LRVERQRWSGRGSGNSFDAGIPWTGFKSASVRDASDTATLKNQIHRHTCPPKNKYYNMAGYYWQYKVLYDDKNSLRQKYFSYFIAKNVTLKISATPGHASMKIFLPCIFNKIAVS
jgi:hypothetical protein